MNSRPSLFAELKRRNVLRAGVLYAGTVWAFGQGLSQFSPAIGLPDWATRWFLIAACIGFPFWIAFAWFYEFTPQGLKRESEIAPDDSIARSTGHRLDKWIIAVLVVAVVLLLTNTFVWRKGAGLASDSALASAPAKSIAVLPFEDLSPGHDHGYFSADMAEELLNALARVQDLKVAGRASSFYYGSRNADLRTIGKALDVSNVLEGSVRSQGADDAVATRRTGAFTRSVRARPQRLVRRLSQLAVAAGTLVAQGAPGARISGLRAAHRYGGLLEALWLAGPVQTCAVCRCGGICLPMNARLTRLFEVLRPAPGGEEISS